MSSDEKTIKIIKRNARASLEDQTPDRSKTEKQSKRDIAKVVTSWIEERKGLCKEQGGTRGFVFGSS